MNLETTESFEGRAKTIPGRADPIRLLVLGVGNELLSDDGLGIHAIRELQARPIPGVTMIELGTAILHGLGFLESADRVLVIDATKGTHPPGTVYLFEPAAQTATQPFASIHALGLFQAARLLSPGKGPPMTVLGVEPERLEYGLELSDCVRSALPQVVSVARDLLSEWGKGAASDDQ